MSRKISLFVIYNLFLYNQNSSINAEPIMGPNVKPVGEQEFPFVVSIQVKENDSNQDGIHVCTGTLISSEHVLTAAHCLANKNKYNHFEILVGNSDWKKGAKYYSEFWITYNTWMERKRRIPEFHMNDIAILILTEKVKNAKIAHLSTKNNEEMYKLTARIAGWGVSDAGTVDPTMRKAELQILTNSRCEEKYRNILEFDPRFHKATLCSMAQPHAVATCGIDGGPLFYKNDKLLGITVGLCFKDVPLSEQVNIHYGIDYFRDFINAVKKNYRIVPAKVTQNPVL